MGGCDRGNFRGYLDNLQQANAQQKAEAFAAVKRGDAERILQILSATPGLLKQASDEDHQANLLIAILYEIKKTRNEQIRRNLIALINKIITERRDNIDLTFKDADSNTVLHRVFWYAITTDNTETSNALTEIGIAFLKMITNSTHFRQILALKNSHNESFLQNIYINMDNVRMSSTSHRHLVAVQQQVGELLTPYKRAQAENVEIPRIDFNAQSFKDRLEELLTDGITYTLMDTPYVFVKEGHTLNQDTWATLNPKQDPFTRTPYNASDLVPNIHIAKALEIFNAHQDNEPELVRLLSVYFDAQSQAQTIDDQFVGNQDVLTRDIKEMVKSYYLQFNRPQDSHSESEEEQVINLDEQVINLDEQSFSEQEQRPFLNQHHQDKDKILNILAVLKSNIQDKKEGRETWYGNNTDTKLAKLRSVAHWLQQNELNDQSKPVVLALIRDICATARNPLGIFKPHSQAEFETMAARNLLSLAGRAEAIRFDPEDLAPLANSDHRRTGQRINSLIRENAPVERNNQRFE